MAEMANTPFPMRLVDGNGNVKIQGDAGLSWSFQEMVQVVDLASRARSGRFRELVRDNFISPLLVTQAPAGKRSKQACLVSGNIISKAKFAMEGPF